MTAPTTVKPSPWANGVCPIGAHTGQSPQALAARTNRSPVVREVRSHRRSGVERAELVAAGIGGAAAMLLLIYAERRWLRRG